MTTLTSEAKKMNLRNEVNIAQEIENKITDEYLDGLVDECVVLDAQMDTEAARDAYIRSGGCYKDL